MKYKLLVAISAVWLGMFLSCGAQAPAPAAAPVIEAKPSGTPKIKLASLVFDFGTTSLVQSVAGKFEFENAGDGVLELKRPTTSCGCTVASVKPESLRLQPGEKGEIGFTLSVGSARGRVEKHINVVSNDPQTPAVNLTLRGEMTVVFDAPPQVMFGELMLGQSTNLSLQVKRLDGKPLQLTKVESTDPSIIAKLEPIESPTGTVANVALSVSLTGQPRQVFSRVNIYAEGFAGPVAGTMVYGQAVGDFRIVPEHVFWGIVAPNLMGSRQIKLELKKPGATFTIRNVTSSLPDMNFAVITEQTGRVYQVVINLTKAPTVSTRGTITVETDMASRPSIVVPVTINVLSRAPASAPVPVNPR